MRLSIFCEGRVVDFEVPESEGTVFISHCREVLVAENHDEDEVNAMDDEEILRKAIGSMDYNSWHKQDRHSAHTELRDTDSIVESAEDTAIKSLETERVRRLIYSRLPDSQADVYYMRVIDGLKFTEIAEILGDKEDNVAKRFHRADKQMKKIKKNYQTPSDFDPARGYQLPENESGKE